MHSRVVVLCQQPAQRVLSGLLASFHASSPIAAAAAASSSPPQKTVLYDFHVAHGGKIVDFAGWLMPVQYKDLGIKESHAHTRSQCSIFDVSHMMQTRVHGKHRFDYIESLITSDIRGLRPDHGTLTVYTNERGGILDDLIVSNTSRDYLYVVSNAGCAPKDYAHMKQAEAAMHAHGKDVVVERIDDMALLALQGPAMQRVLQRGLTLDLAKMPFMSTAEATVFGIANCRVTRCGYTGEDGVEISVPLAKAAELASQLLAFDECRLAGLGARDTLRLEAGLCLYGNDIDETRTPVEAGLNWLISKRRREARDFPGASIILQQLKDKPAAKRVGLKMANDAGPSARQHMKLFEPSEPTKEIGEVTSGCLSPTLKQNIAMAYVPIASAKPGTRLLVEIRKKMHEASVVKLPFVPTNYYQISSS